MKTGKPNSKSTYVTGDRPTGPLHLGHYVGTLKNRLSLQETHQAFIIIADVQALTDHFRVPQLIHENVTNLLLDYLAVGLRPSQNTFFIQSTVPELFELTSYFLNFVTVARLERNPTIKDEIKSRFHSNAIPVGFLTYPVSQIADILAFKPDLVPVGEDQLPILELANEIVRRFNQTYGIQTFSEIRSLVGEVGRLPGIDGHEKMSKSAGNAIFLSDPADTIRKKVHLMFTDPTHLRTSDPGHLEGNVVFMFLDIFDPDKTELEKMKEHYQRGGLGDSKVKARLVDVLELFLAPIRSRRMELALDREQLTTLLQEGTERAQAVASQTLNDVKSVMQLQYFIKKPAHPARSPHPSNMAHPPHLS